MSWATFRQKYETEVVPSLAVKTQSKIDTVLDAVEDILGLINLRELTAEKISTFQAKLRSRELAESTIAGYLAHLSSALQWAVQMEFLPAVPMIKRPKRAKTSKIMKGRPITEAEFQKMLDKVESIVGTESSSSWRYYLDGLWLSGLRLGESLNLYWDDETKLCVCRDGDALMLRIPAELEKGNQERLLPIAPDFAEFLVATPEAERTGPVFNPKAQRVHGPRLQDTRVSEIIRDIGEAAQVMVDLRRQKHASAHDHRRSFGACWSALVMPQVLMELMRHESIETTLKYYVGRNAQRTTEILQQAWQTKKAAETATVTLTVTPTPTGEGKSDFQTTQTLTERRLTK